MPFRIMFRLKMLEIVHREQRSTQLHKKTGVRRRVQRKEDLNSSHSSNYIIHSQVNN